MSFEELLANFPYLKKDICYRILENSVYYLEEIKDSVVEFKSEEEYWNLCLENENLKEILAQAGVDFSAVVKTGVFLADMNDFAAMNEVYAQYFSKECPARACVEVSKLPKGALVEIELIAIAE